MSIIAEFTTPAGEFVLGEALSAHPEVRVELEKLVPTRTEVLPFFWARGGDLGAFADAVRDLPAVEELRVVDRMDGRSLYRVEWASGATDLGRAIRSADAAVLEASGQRNTWRFELRFRSHEDVKTFQRLCTDREIPLELRRLHSLTEMSADGRYDLTPEQRDTLLTALEHGYFNEPRDVTLEELAEILDLSPTAVSGRMRRAEAALITRTLVTDA